MAHVTRILRYADDRAITASRARSGARTTTELTGSRIFIDDVVYSSLGEDDSDDLEDGEFGIPSERLMD